MRGPFRLDDQDGTPLDAAAGPATGGPARSELQARGPRAEHVTDEAGVERGARASEPPGPLLAARLPRLREEEVLVVRGRRSG